MHIINQYLTREIFKYFAVILAMVIGIYIAVDFFEKVDDFMQAGLPFSRVFSFFLFKIPFIITQITPVGILLAILVVFGLMNKNNEIIALRSSGVSVFYLLKPVLVIGGIATVFLFVMAEVIVPTNVNKAKRIWLREVRKEAAVASDEKNIWIKGKRLIVHIKYYHAGEQAIYGVTMNYFDDHFKLIRRIDARKGLYYKNKEKWLLDELMEQRLNKEDGKYRITFSAERFEPLDFRPEDLKRVVRKSEEMSFKELLIYLRKVEDEGYDATILKVDLYAKFAFPFVCFILSIIGVGIALRGRVKEGLPVSIAYGIGIAFLYWIFYSFCVSLGYGEMLPPLIAAGTADFVFLCFGILILLNAD